MEIAEIIKKIVNDNEEMYSLIATVTEVDENARTCDVEPINGDAAIFNVKLQAAESGATGFVSIPVVGSQVVISFLSKDTAFVSLQTSVEKILIDTELITINGGENGGLINISDIVGKLNTLESEFNTLKGVFAAWVPIPNDGGGSLKGAIGSFAGSSLTPTTTTDIEDTKITH